MARRARWVVNGTETDTKVENFEGHFRLFIKTKLPYSDFCNRPFNLKKKFPVPSTAYKRVVTIEPTVVSPWRNSITPSLEAVTSEPELIAVPGQEGHAVYCNRVNHGRFFIPSRSGYRLYERYAVNDGSAVTKRPSIQFMGVGRYGLKPKTAELKVQMQTKWPTWKARLNEATYPKSRFFTPHDSTLMEKNRQAVISAKRLSDQILLDTNTKPGFLAGLPRFAGDPIVI
jgi:hypothetical protein